MITEKQYLKYVRRVIEKEIPHPYFSSVIIDDEINVDEFSKTFYRLVEEAGKEGIISDREAFVLFQRTGFYDRPRTLREVGKAVDVNEERVRQIEAIAYRKLTRPKANNILEKLFKEDVRSGKYGKVSQFFLEEADGLRAQINALNTSTQKRMGSITNAVRNVLQKYKKRVDDLETAYSFLREKINELPETPSKILEMDVSELDLSVRVQNCLDNMNITTISQLVELSEYDLLKIKNFGKTSLREVKSKLLGYGLHLNG